MKSIVISYHEIKNWHYTSFVIVIDCLITLTARPCTSSPHDDGIKWKHFPRNWPFVRGIHRSPVNSPHKGQWRGALMFSLICVWINDWVNNREAGDLRCYRAHYDVIVMGYSCASCQDNRHIVVWLFIMCRQSRFVLTHLPLEKMAVISQTMFLWMKSFVFWLKFH